MYYYGKISDVETQDELSELIENEVIPQGVTIRGEEILILSDVTEVQGPLGLCSCQVNSLGRLQVIGADFWISSSIYQSNVKTLGLLQRIEGDCTLRYSSVEDLGDLNYVGGKLSLRDTPIENLGKLKFVGGDLFLPIRFKDKIDLSEIEIQGNVKFWNDAKKSKVTDKSSLDLVQVANIPEWKFSYESSPVDIDNAGKDRQKFYQLFQKAFERGEYYDLKGNNNYAFTLHNQLRLKMLDFIEIGIPIISIKKDFKTLRTYYPESRDFPYFDAIEAFEEKAMFEQAFEILSEFNLCGIDKLALYELRLKRTLFTGEFALETYGLSGLTEFGSSHKEGLVGFLQQAISHFEKEHNKEFLDIFFDRNRETEKVSMYEIDYYESFYSNKEQFQSNVDILNSYYDYRDPIPPVVYGAISRVVRKLKREAEDLFRESRGMPKVGEGWVSETNLFYEIKEAFFEVEVMHHASPKWLGRQHYDIYIPKYKIAIEYQGKQHVEPVDYFGGEEAFEKNQERDQRKKELSSNNQVELIEVFPGYAYSHVIRKIKNAIRRQKKELGI